MIALRGCLQSLSGVPCRISRIDGKGAVNVLSLEPCETVTPKFNEDFFSPAYKSWLKADAGKGFALVPRFMRVSRDDFEAKTIGEETKDTFKIEIQEPYTLLKGRVALVSGAAQGFGYEIATRLASSGSIVFLDDINSEGVNSLSKEMNARYGEGATYPLHADVTKEGDIINMFDRIVETVGGIDLVVSNVPRLKAYSILDQPLDDFEFVTKHNYIAFMLMAKYSANIMRKQWSNPRGPSTT